jgi:hypothetical protein
MIHNNFGKTPNNSTHAVQPVQPFNQDAAKYQLREDNHTRIRPSLVNTIDPTNNDTYNMVEYEYVELIKGQMDGQQTTTNERSKNALKERSQQFSYRLLRARKE